MWRFYPESRRGRVAVLLGLAVLIVAGWLLRPAFRQLPRVVRLVREPAPLALPIPVEGVTPGELTDTWNAPRGDGRQHKGIDIFAPRETQVLAATRGLVVRRGWNSLGGRRVAILGPGGQYHYYAHLEEYGDPKLWDWVEAGEVIGYVGDSGNAQGTPTHLHYGIYEITGAVNPYPRLTHPAMNRRAISSAP